MLEFSWKRTGDLLSVLVVLLVGAASYYLIRLGTGPITSEVQARPAKLNTKLLTAPAVKIPVKPKVATRIPLATKKVNPDYLIPPVTNGVAPMLVHIPTKEPVVFLGIDDGEYKQLFEEQLMAANNIKASLFLANRFIEDNPAFFRSFETEGSVIEDHTIDHALLSKLTYEQQKQEICGEADLQEQQFGRRPILFRPPGGDYNDFTAQAAAACGMRAVVLWIAKANGGSMQYQIGNSLRPGDIVLMHFRPEFKSDLAAFVKAEKAAGLHTELLENWLSPTSPTSS